MTPARMAAIHAAAFGGRGQVWSEAEIAAMCARPAIHSIGVDDDGFALLQILAPEAELLTLAVDPLAQGRGLGRITLEAAMARAARAGATTMFLEVAEDNAAACALYRRAGFMQTGRRRGYYARKGATPVDALILSRMLNAENSGNAKES
ncbi:GNAT family N-acetyltransferase [Roseicyclus mahoneyensis]|uniref:Ribosomal-protein-alanine N-acetyltransferase n=1 Tax=Roseicyclus mahoneyensis TaxID=164332 RepID=A0A316GID2_9RHOB|nr:GNAT family N-acetyltransferase [Roseicyclus mahoneyensis]PWK60857.1 ribosomal-protein-alanine N-acetyltransferase [Roseicyclus mahoneyensis]